MARLIGMSERGRRVGEYHPRAKLTDHEVDLIRTLHEEHGMSYGQLAVKFEIAKSTVQSIIEYRTWSRRPMRWRRAD